MISLDGRMVSVAEGISIVDSWLDAEFQGGRHQTRIDKIEFKKKNNPGYQSSQSSLNTNGRKK